MMKMFESGTRVKKKPAAKPWKKPALTDAPGKLVNNGLTIEWSHGNTDNELTPVEIEAIKRQTGCKTVKTFRALQVKQMMDRRTLEQMAKALKCSERTVWGIRTALLSVRGGVKRG